MLQDKGLTRDVEAVLKAHGRDNKLIVEFVDDDTLFKACTGSRQKFEIGHRVKIGARVKGAWNADCPCPGAVRFAGPHHAGKGERVLVELDQPVGKNNGIIDGHQYYKLDELHGVLVKPDKLQLVERRMLFRRGRAGYGIKFGGATAANLTVRRASQAALRSRESRARPERRLGTLVALGVGACMGALLHGCAALPGCAGLCAPVPLCPTRNGPWSPRGNPINRYVR